MDRLRLKSQSTTSQSRSSANAHPRRRPPMAASGNRRADLVMAAAVFFLLFSVVARVAHAAQPNENLPGFKSDNVLEAHGIDNVNLYSGDPGVVIPLGPEYTLGPNFKWQLKAHYSAKLWHMSGCSFDTTTFADLHGDPTIG